MKNIFWLFIGLLFFTSCEGILDSQIPEHNTVDGNVVTDQASAEVALTGAYSYLAGASWEFYYIEVPGNLAGTLWCTYRGTSTNSTSGGGYDYELIDNAFTYENTIILDQWKGAYEMVLAANWVIDRVEAVGDNKFSGDRKKEILAEARFLRFFAHYYVFKLFCKFYDINSPEGLIYREKPVGVGSHMVARLDVAGSYAKLLADLEYVIENGPRFTDAYHVSRDAAKAFKAEVLMMRGNKEDYQTVIDLADDLMARFPLENTLAGLYSKGSVASEVIFARFQSQKATWSTPVMKTFSNNINYYLTEHLLNLVQGSDYYGLYQGETIVYNPQGIPSTYRNTLTKMAPTGKSNEEIKATTKVFYMRAAELYLLKAEAVARLTGDGAKVRPIINDHLYSRANRPAIPDQAYTSNELLAEVYKAYLAEMALENGIEFPLAVRFNDPLTGERYLISQKRNLNSEQDMWKAIQPIPQEEVRVNNLMKQNAGYPEK